MSGRGSGIGSIGSATGSNLAGVGPSLNVTATAAMTIGAKLGGSAREIQDGLLDVKRHEVCLTSRNRAKCAYVPVISTDNIVAPDSVCANKSNTALPGIDHKSQLDMSMGSYYREVADARSDLEYCLRKSQVSLHSFNAVTNGWLRLFQDHLMCASIITHRRNSIIFGTEKDFETATHNRIVHAGTWKQLEGTKNPGFCCKIYKFEYDSRDSNMHQHVRGICLAESTYAGVTHDMKDVEDAMMDLELLLNQFSKSSTKVHNLSNNSSDLIEAPELSYAGIALTDACLHPQNGDTAVTLNIFSALTVDNGPFDVQCSDDLMWISSIELPDFDKDGLRRFRAVLTPAYLATCLSRLHIVSTDLYLRRFASRPNTTTITDLLKHKPGNPSRKTFLIAPQKRGFGLLRRSSIQDKQRHIGTAISSCHASKRLDMVNGACAKF